ncbi:hypothetical protein BAUCODRAFT_410289 [Baudoinia panamericana UAMH 10762]|uniref:Lipocalin-like domain-containing protein n=1 Tax=Baudoinia panamericana (strain UAMH 10762) TaxID=717646 RepID=M2MMT8_BAUPA|nr:uncharacterized protein BAUCODRAFT_410289 [Baudoinia panamericana UAMH 10762]EMC97991.1 hypothetical protein BAUCODRAFT_410289 [Baudoinia panamericana UAMH 10762]
MATGSIRDQLLGAWELAEYCAFPVDNPDAKIYPMGKDAQGIIMYTHNGYMSAQLHIPGQPPFKSDDLNGGTTEELAEAGKNYFAYTGPFYLDESSKEPLLLHQMANSSFPNWQGNVQRRVMKITEEAGVKYLTLGPEAPHVVMGEQRMTRLVWRRLPDNGASRPT